jgi:alkyldihydroxyacetonephosphate synthase
VSDSYETAFSMSTSKESKGVGKWVTKGLTQYMKSKGWDLDRICLSFIGYEGSPTHVRYEKALVGKIVRRHGGLSVGQGPGALYDQKKFDTPYIRDFLLDRGALADVSETASPWSAMLTLHDTIVERFHETRKTLGVPGYIMCHLSHSYHSGACQYFTFAITDTSADALASYDAIKQTIQEAFVELGATVSHHHGVGEEHSPWLARDISPAGVELQRRLFEAVDPGHHANPGKIIHDGVPGVSSNSAKPGTVAE